MRKNSPQKPDRDPAAAVPRSYWKLLLLSATMAAYSASAAPTLTGTDLGSPSNPGSVKTAADGKITVVGGGSDIWNSSDNGYYAYFKVTGDFDYVVKVESLKGSAGDDGWAKAELMARLEDPNSPGVGPQGGDPFLANMTTRSSSDTPATDPDTGTAGVAGRNIRGPQWRALRDNACSWTTPNPAYPPNMPDNWMRMERVGSVLYMYTGNDGKTWNMFNPYAPQGWDTKGSWPTGTDNPDVAFFNEAWPSSIMLGLAVTAHADAYTATAVFSNLAPYTPTPVAISTQPVKTLNVAANSKLQLSVTATGDPVHYEWRKDGKAVGTNGVGATLTIPLAQTTDSGSYTVRVFGGGKEVISEAAAVSVTVDTTPPTMTDAKPMASQTTVQVTFSEPVTAATATVTGNYTFSPAVAVTAATLSADGYQVTLTTAAQALNTLYTLTVANVKDTAGNTVASGTKATFTSVSLLKGYAFYERWMDANGDLGDLAGLTAAVASGDLRTPDFAGIVTQFGAPWGAADNYNARVRTFFTPPTTGNYVFFVSSDDYSSVFLSTDDTPANKKLIAQESGWSNQYQWTTPGSGVADTKRSDFFPSTEWPDGNTIKLTSGKKYYMEILLNEGTGGDGADVAYIKEGAADPVNDSTTMNLKGDVISWYESADILPPVIVTEPVASLTIAAGGTASMSVTATNPGPAALTYQWQRNGKDIAGATNATYTISNASSADIGQYWVKVSNPKTSVLSGQGDTPTVVLVTATGVFTIEAEDFNYESGKAKAEASVMPYKGNAYDGLSAAFDVDYHNTGATTSADGWTPIYRTGEPITSGTEAEMGTNTDGQWSMTRAGAWDMTQNYKIGWIGTGDWGNYTRTFPAGTYDVFAAQSYDGVSASQLNSSIAFVTGANTATQTLEPIGIFDAPGTGAWSRNNLVRMTDSAGTPKTVTFKGGEQTIRWTYNSGDADYLLFIPVKSTGNSFTSVKLTAGGITIAWTGGTLEGADVVTGPWTTMPNATSPATFPTTGTKKFYRVK